MVQLGMKMTERISECTLFSITDYMFAQSILFAKTLTFVCIYIPATKTFSSPFTPNDNSVAFPKMADVEGHSADPKQPAIDNDKFTWPGDEGTKKKAVPGNFVIEKYLTPTTIGSPIEKEDGDDAGGDTDKPTSRTLKRAGGDYFRQVTLTAGGFIGGFLLNN